jgi:hypothetical protein
MKMIFLTYLLVLFASLSSEAKTFKIMGHEVGNGGGIIVCKDDVGNINKTELLDLFEARVLRGLTLDMGDASQDYHEKIETVLNKLARVSPTRAKKYKELYANFFENTVLIPDFDLVFIPDADNIGIPKNCSLRQAAVQRAPEFPNDKRYFISKEYWDLMDNNSKAALVLHEIIYNEAIFFRHDNSKAVRYVNSYITSSEINTISQWDFNYLLTSAKFNVVDIYGGFFYVGKMTRSGYIFFTSINTGFQGIDKYFNTNSPDEYQFGSLRLGQDFRLEQDNQGYISAFGVLQYSTNNIEIESFEKFDLKFEAGKLRLNSESNFFKVTLKVNSNILNIQVKKDSKIDFSLGFDTFENLNSYSGAIKIKNLTTGYDSGYIESNTLLKNSLTPSGVIKLASIASNQTLKTVQGPKSFTWFGRASIFSFDDSGQVQKGVIYDEEVNTAEGVININNPKWVKFLDNGLAELIPNEENQ